MNEKPRPETTLRPPTEKEIRERAYQLYEQSGCAPGRDWEHWLKAESQLLAERQGAARPSPGKWDWHYRTLLEIRDRLRAGRAEHASAIRTPLPKGAGDAIDIANDENERDVLFAEISLADAELAEVEAALDRIQNGTYGLCEITGKPIAAARLRAIPWTRRGLPA